MNLTHQRYAHVVSCKGVVVQCFPMVIRVSKATAVAMAVAAATQSDNQAKRRSVSFKEKVWYFVFSGSLDPPVILRLVRKRCLQA